MHSILIISELEEQGKQEEEPPRGPRKEITRGLGALQSVHPKGPVSALPPSHPSCPHPRPPPQTSLLPTSAKKIKGIGWELPLGGEGGLLETYLGLPSSATGFLVQPSAAEWMPLLTPGECSKNALTILVSFHFSSFEFCRTFPASPFPCELL